MGKMQRDARARGEATPLLDARHQEPLERSHDDDRDALGTPRFPFHPTAPHTTPRWRKLGLQFFDNTDQTTQALDESDVWRLDPQFQGARAAADLAKQIPRTGRARLLRGVCAANRKRLLWLVALNAIATPLAALRPLLLLYLYRVGFSVSNFEATTEQRPLGDALHVYAPIGVMVVAELAVLFLRSHAASAAVLIYLQLSSSLSSMITQRVVTAGASAAALSSPPPATATAMGRKQRLTEITNMLTNQLTTIASVPLVAHSTWTMVVRLMVSVGVLFNVVTISWKVISVVVGVYAVLFVVEITAGTSLALRFETAFARRLNVIHESVMSIRMVKMNAWEDKMDLKIHEARTQETAAATRLIVLAAIVQQIVQESPALVTALLFLLASSSPSIEPRQAGMSSVQAFTAFVLIYDGFRCAEKIKSAFYMIVNGGRAWGKVDSFLHPKADCVIHSTTSLPDVPSTPPGEYVIAEMRSACITPANQVASAPPLLINVDWTVRTGELVVIHGAAGVGKSILLTALLGDRSMSRVLGGSVCGPPRDCRIAYCSQDPWLQTLSIRDNILFGATFDEEKYWAVVEACGLLEDLVVLPDGDATAVGPRGINLSSGQTARIALARACYADADLYLLDCPLANVDAVVQSQIFRKCIVELLMFKTVVIVTHNPEYIGSSLVDQLVEVTSHGVRVKNRLAVRQSKAQATTPMPRLTRRMRDYQSTIRSRRSEDRSLWITPASSESMGLVARVRSSRTRPTTGAENSSKRLETFISIAAIQQFIGGSGTQSSVSIAAALLLSVLWAAVCIWRDVWILSWMTLPPSFFSSSDHREGAAIVYAVLVLATMLLGLLAQACVLAFIVTSTAQLFSRMVRTILRASMQFFYTTPLGELLNPFVTDVGEVDLTLPQHLSKLILSCGTLFARAMVFGWFLGPVGFVMTVVGNAVLLRAQSIKFYVGLTHFVRVTNATQLSFMAETLDGENVLRAFGVGHIAQTVRALERAYETKSKIEYFTDTFNSYAILREEALLAALSLGLLVVLSMRSLIPAEFLLVLLYILLMQQEYVTRFGSGMVSTCDQLYSIERLRQFGDAEVEAETSLAVASSVIAEQWPERGGIAFDHVDFTYENVGEVAIPTLALHSVSFSLRGGEKVGVIGRTGSGKSSLAMALLRVHPLRSGRILLDGVDLRTVPLAQLRRSFTMIPQSPTFYRCSIRDYLDPFHEFDDARLWKELLTVELGQRVQSLEEELLDNGENWSLGQRQLLCFARALLRPSRVVVLDEAFSCVDQSCQEKILRILRERFASSTVVLITHRLDQILAFDRIVVMKGGRVVENGSAAELASDAGSVFYEFLETSLLTL